MPAIGSYCVYSALVSAWFGEVPDRVLPLDKPEERHSACVSLPAMTMKFFGERKQLMARIGLGIGIVVCVGIGSLHLYSGTLSAIEQVDHVNTTLAELSRYVVKGHAGIRERVTELDALDDDALARFDKGVERRVAQFRNLKINLAQQTIAYFWAEPLRDNASDSLVEEERRAYLTAASATAATAAGDRPMRLRMFDLHAQKLVQTIEALRDSAETARARGLVAIDGIVKASSGFSVLLLAFVAWHPVFGRTRRQAGPAPLA